jgi:putative transposase
MKAYPTKVLCKVMEVSRSGFYEWKKQCNKKIDADVKMVVALKNLHTQSKASYGSRRMAKALVAEGYNVGRYKVRRLMKQNAIVCKQRRRYTQTTKSNHSLLVADNLLDRNFYVNEPNRVWVSDITYLWTAEGWLYIAAVLDLFSRRVVGWAIDDHMQTNLVKSAFIMAKIRRNPEPGLLHHSDRGIQYVSEQYQQTMHDEGVIVSMSRKGNCWDNAVMERFFGSLKAELTDHKHYATRSEAKIDVVDFIESFYNNHRLHSTLEYKSPVAFELQYQDFKTQSKESRVKSPAGDRGNSLNVQFTSMKC